MHHNAHCRACGKRGATEEAWMLVPVKWALQRVPIHHACAQGEQRARLPPVPGE